MAYCDGYRGGLLGLIAAVNPGELAALVSRFTVPPPE